MSEELPSAEQVAQMRAQIEAFNAARREAAAAQIDEKLAILLDLVGSTFTPEIAEKLEQEARNFPVVTNELAQLLSATARLVRTLPRAVSSVRERAIAELMAQDVASTEEPAAE